MRICSNGDLHTDGAVIALGMFDGVHVGHQILLQKASALAKWHQVPLVVQTFAEHPMRLLDPDHCPPMLTTLPERIRLIEAKNVDIFCAPHFSAQMRDTLPEEFVGELVRRWKPKAIVVGYNYSFGAEGKGSPSLLTALGNALGFETVIIPMIRIGAEPVSASRIRERLEKGFVRQAWLLLGRPFAREMTLVRQEAAKCVLRCEENGKLNLPTGRYRALLDTGERKVPVLAAEHGDGLVWVSLPETFAVYELMTLQYLKEADD